MKTATVLASLLFGALVATAHAAPPMQPADSLSGEVLETRSVDSYTYLRLKTATGEAWAAVPTTAVAKGARVTIDRPMFMQNFESKSLKKTFDKIAFGVIATPGAKPGDTPGAAPVARPAMPHGSMGAAAPTAAPLKPIKVAKAGGPEGKTVAEVVGGKAALKDKTVVVRGQVVKFSGGIMGKNWVHLRDGSGSAADGSDDLIVTTQDAAAVGDIVNARGTVRTEVKLGAGYSYAVLIDGAALSKP